MSFMLKAFEALRILVSRAVINRRGAASVGLFGWANRFGSRSSFAHGARDSRGTL